MLRALIGLALLPLCWAATRAAFGAATAGAADGPMIPAPALAVAAGLALWLAAFAFAPRPVKTYVLAHELTHALWGLAMGADVHGMRISGTGGSVRLSKTNFLVTLAPYFFPLYTMLVIALYGVAALFFDPSGCRWIWLGLVGFTWGFHATFTLHALSERQSDIRAYGRLFSYAVIYLMNTLGIGLWIVAVSDAALDDYCAGLAAAASAAYHACATSTVLAAGALARRAGF